MGSQIAEQSILHATICEVERGLFHVAYRMDGPGMGQHLLPRYQVGASASDARLRIEQRAREYGYGSVAWDEELSEPPVGVSSEHQSARLGH